VAHSALVFLAGLWVGAVFGYLILSIMLAGKQADDEEDKATYRR
jgi:TctA family transporter